MTNSVINALNYSYFLFYIFVISKISIIFRPQNKLELAVCEGNFNHSYFFAFYDDTSYIIRQESYPT